MQTLMVYSESGGVGKTTTAVSLAMVAASGGKTEDGQLVEPRRTVLIDLDPRAAATKWIGVEPAESGLHVGAILGDEDPEGWAESLAIPSGWHDQLRVIPSARSVSNREADRADHAELRLRVALAGLDADLVVIDCPNRQGGPLTLAALNAADSVVYAAKPSQDGVDGFIGARQTVTKFLRNRERLGAPAQLSEAGIVVNEVATTIMSRPAVASIDELRETGLLLTPLVPQRAIVPEVRIAGQWYGRYTKGEPVLDAYTQIAGKVLR